MEFKDVFLSVQSLPAVSAYFLQKNESKKCAKKPGWY